MRFSLIRQAVISSLLLACFILPRELIAESFNVTIDTTPLNGMSGVLAFDFIDGDGLNNNTATITNFTTDGTLGPSSASGDVTGTLDSGLVNIGDADFFNELLQDITYGSFIIFNIDITVNGPFSPFPDAFSFFLLDSGLLPFPTSDPLGSDALFILEINSSNPMPVEFSSSFASVMIVDTVTEEADLNVSKSDAVDPVTVGDDVTYTVIVSNNGPDAAQNVVLTDTLPGSATFDSATPDQGSCSESGGTVTCELGSLASGSSVNIVIVVTTTTDGTLTNTATVVSDTTDPNTSNNSATEQTTVDTVIVATFSVFADGGNTVELERSDVLGGLVGTGNGGNIIATIGSTGGGGIRSDGDFIVDVGAFSTTGDVIANGNIAFPGGGGNCGPVGGDVIAGGTISDPNNCIPDGNEFPNQGLPYLPPALPDPICDFSVLPSSVNPPAGVLNPGSYNEVDLRKGPFTLVSGRYVINNFRADNGGVINIDLSAPAADGSGLGNEIIICVQQRLGLFRDTHISLAGTPAGTAANVYWEAHGTGESGMGAGTFIGTLYAPNGTIRFTNNNTSVAGALYAGESVFFGNSTTLDFVPVTVTGAPLFP